MCALAEVRSHGPQLSTYSSVMPGWCMGVRSSTMARSTANVSSTKWVIPKL